MVPTGHEHLVDLSIHANYAGGSFEKLADITLTLPAHHSAHFLHFFHVNFFVGHKF
jgi:hypothetical protein